MKSFDVGIDVYWRQDNTKKIQHFAESFNKIPHKMQRKCHNLKDHGTFFF